MGSSGAETWTGAAAAAWAGAPPEVEEMVREDEEEPGLQYPVLPQQRTDERDFSKKVSELFEDLVSDMSDGFASQPDVRISRLGDEDADEHVLDQATIDKLTGDGQSSSEALDMSRSNQYRRQQAIDPDIRTAKAKCDIPRRAAIRAAGSGSLGDAAAYERAVSLYEAQSYAAAELEYARAIEAKDIRARGTVEDTDELAEVTTEGYNTEHAAQSCATAERACVTLATAAAVAFEAAGKLTRVDTTGGAPKPSSSPGPPGDSQMPSVGQAGVTGGGGGAGYDHKRPSAMAKYRECVALYTKALQQQGIGDEPSRTERAQYFSARAEARIRLEHFSAAVSDCDHALELAHSSSPSTEKRRRRAASMLTKLQRRSDQIATKASETLDDNSNDDGDSDRIAAARAAVDELKAKGNAAFKHKQWSDAAEAYRAGIIVAKTCGSDGHGTEAAHAELTQALRNLHGNHAAALLNVDDWSGATTEAKAAVGYDHRWNKGHFRLGCALEGSAADDISHGLTRYASAIER